MKKELATHLVQAALAKQLQPKTHPVNEVQNTTMRIRGTIEIDAVVAVGEATTKVRYPDVAWRDCVNFLIGLIARLDPIVATRAVESLVAWEMVKRGIVTPVTVKVPWGDEGAITVEPSRAAELARLMDNGYTGFSHAEMVASLENLTRHGLGQRVPYGAPRTVVSADVDFSGLTIESTEDDA